MSVNLMARQGRKAERNCRKFFPFPSSPHPGSGWLQDHGLMPAPARDSSGGARAHPGLSVPTWVAELVLGSPHGHRLHGGRSSLRGCTALEVHPHGKERESKGLPRGRPEARLGRHPVPAGQPHRAARWQRGGHAAPRGSSSSSSSGGSRALYQLQGEGRARHSSGRSGGRLWPKARFAPVFLLRCKWHASRLLSVASL